MNSAPHLLNEDRAEFERLLDETLRTAAYRPDDPPAAAEHRLDAAQLRAMALSATGAIAGCAAAEYQRYIRLRAESRAPAPGASAPGAGGPAADSEGGEPATADDDPAADATGFGLAAMVTVLVPVLAGIAAVLFLVLGYVLRAVDPDPAVSRPLVSVGWIFALLAAAGALVAMGCMVVTALRNGASRDGAATERAAALDSAHDAWRQALLERGLLPFLREALAAPPADTADGLTSHGSAPESDAGSPRPPSLNDPQAPGR